LLKNQQLISNFGAKFDKQPNLEPVSTIYANKKRKNNYVTKKQLTTIPESSVSADASSIANDNPNRSRKIRKLTTSNPSSTNVYKLRNLKSFVEFDERINNGFIQYSQNYLFATDDSNNEIYIKFSSLSIPFKDLQELINESSDDLSNKSIFFLGFRIKYSNGGKAWDALDWTIANGYCLWITLCLFYHESSIMTSIRLLLFQNKEEFKSRKRDLCEETANFLKLFFKKYLEDFITFKSTDINFNKKDLLFLKEVSIRISFICDDTELKNLKPVGGLDVDFYINKKILFFVPDIMAFGMNSIDKSNILLISPMDRQIEITDIAYVRDLLNGQRKLLSFNEIKEILNQTSNSFVIIDNKNHLSPYPPKILSSSLENFDGILNDLQQLLKHFNDSKEMLFRYHQYFSYLNDHEKYQFNLTDSSINFEILEVCLAQIFSSVLSK
jgi:hypothetical protein